MDIIEFKKQITADEELVLKEFKQLQRIFELKKVIRYGGNREADTNHESVAEHVYGMHALCNYFLPLEDENKVWDKSKIRTMITFHDLEEVITGDIIGYLKTDEDRKEGEAALKKVLAEVPELLRSDIEPIIEEYEARESIEAKFVKALDKIEPVFHLYNETGKKHLHKMGTTRAQHDSIKLPYFQPFPFIKRFYDVTIERMDNAGFFA